MPSVPNKPMIIGEDHAKKWVDYQYNNSDVKHLQNTARGHVFRDLPTGEDLVKIIDKLNIFDYGRGAKWFFNDKLDQNKASQFFDNLSTGAKKQLGNAWWQFSPYINYYKDTKADRKIKNIINAAENSVAYASSVPVKTEQHSKKQSRQLVQLQALETLQQQYKSGAIKWNDALHKLDSLLQQGAISVPVYKTMQKDLWRIATGMALIGKPERSMKMMNHYFQMTDNKLGQAWTSNKWTYFGIPIALATLLGGGLIWGLSSLFSGGKKKKKRKHRPGHYGAEPEGYKPNGYYDIA